MVDPAVEVGVNLYVRIVDERMWVGPLAGVRDGEVERRAFHGSDLRIVGRYAEHEHIAGEVGGVGEVAVAGADRG